VEHWSRGCPVCCEYRAVYFGRTSRVVPWIDEDLDPRSGTWLARAVLLKEGSKIPERGKDYNHSTFCDLIITGLIGLRPQAGETVEVNPLIPDNEWPYFCLDNLAYHGRRLTIFYDRTGQRYHRGKGLRVLVDGKEMARTNRLGRLSAKF